MGPWGWGPAGKKHGTGDKALASGLQYQAARLQVTDLGRVWPLSFDGNKEGYRGSVKSGDFARSPEV